MSNSERANKTPSKLLLNSEPASMKYILPIIFLLIISANIPLDIHVPAMPTIELQLNIPTSYVQLTISLFLLSYGTFPILFGILADGLGRRKIIIIALLILAFSSVLCSIATTAFMLLSGRFLQGVGAAGCTCMSRAVMRDSYRGEHMARIVSLLGIAIEITLSLSPMIGGYLVQSFGWHSNFIIVIFLAIIVLLSVLVFYKETSIHHHKDSLKFSSFLKSSREVLTNKVYNCYVWGIAAAFSSAMSYFTISPFIIQSKLHYSAKTYGLLTLLVTGSVVLGSLFNASLVKKLGCYVMSSFGLFLLLISGIAMYILSIINPMSLITVIAPSVVSFFGLALLFGNCMSGALTPFSKNAGVASSLYTVTQIMSAFIITIIISALSEDTAKLLAIIYIVTSGLALFNAFINRPVKIKISST